MKAALAQYQLRWVRHVIRIPEYGLPRQILYGQLLGASRNPGDQKQRYKDHLKDTLKKCGVKPAYLEATAMDCFSSQI